MSRLALAGGAGTRAVEMKISTDRMSLENVTRRSFEPTTLESLKKWGARGGKTDREVTAYECLVPSRVTHFGFAVELYLLARNLDPVPPLPVATKYDADSIGECA